jgi:beta-galactosidase
MSRAGLRAKVSSHVLREDRSYDVAAVRVQAVDEWDNLLYFSAEPLRLTVEGPIEIIGPDVIPLRGGMGGTYVRSTGVPGRAVLTLSNRQLGEVKIPFTVKLTQSE